IGVDPRQREHAGADLDQAAGAGDRPGERGAGVVVARGKRRRSQGHAARAGERADALIEAREIERGAARDRESATSREGIRSPGLKLAGTDRGGAPLCIVGGEDRRARAVLPVPILVRLPAPPIVPPNVALLPLVSKVPPPEFSVTARLLMKPDRNCKAPP